MRMMHDHYSKVKTRKDFRKSWRKKRPLDHVWRQDASRSWRLEGLFRALGEVLLFDCLSFFGSLLWDWVRVVEGGTFCPEFDSRLLVPGVFLGFSWDSYCSFVFAASGKWGVVLLSGMHLVEVDSDSRRMQWHPPRRLFFARRWSRRHNDCATLTSWTHFEFVFFSFHLQRGGNAALWTELHHGSNRFPDIASQQIFHEIMITV